MDPSLQVDVRPLFSRRLKDEHGRNQEDDMRRRYIEDKWRYVFTIFFFLLFCITFSDLTPLFGRQEEHPDHKNE